MRYAGFLLRPSILPCQSSSARLARVECQRTEGNCRLSRLFQENSNLIRICFYVMMPNVKASIRIPIDWFDYNDYPIAAKTGRTVVDNTRARRTTRAVSRWNRVVDPCARRAMWVVSPSFREFPILAARCRPSANGAPRPMIDVDLESTVAPPPKAVLLTESVNSQATSISVTSLTCSGISAVASSFVQSPSA
jgi:hypothetical protein